MTLDEKIGQMSQSTSMNTLIRCRRQIKDENCKGRWGSFLNAGSPEDRAEAQRIAVKESRLHIPLLFARDVIHGYHTIFPIPLGESASWDPPLIEQAARIAAHEAFSEGIRWTFAPMVDITRDPRWGRVAEGLGEDPYLSSMLAAAMVHGFQSDSLDSAGALAACVKHYVGYGAAEAGREYNSTWIPEGLLRDIYSPPFRAALDAGRRSHSSCRGSTLLNGVPATGNTFTAARDSARRMEIQRGHGGQRLYGHSGDDSARLCFEPCRRRQKSSACGRGYGDGEHHISRPSQSPYYKRASGTCKVNRRRSARNILRLKFQLGLFDQHFDEPELAAIKPNNSEALGIAKRLAAESMVLLKNDGVLPLSSANWKSSRDWSARR